MKSTASLRAAGRRRSSTARLWRGAMSLSPQFSPDSSRVLYVADQDTDEVFEIYSVPAGGGTPTKLNGPLVAEGDVSTSAVQPRQ